MAKWKIRNPIKILDPLVRTVKAPYARMSTDGFVPGWDKIPGMSQHAMRDSLDDRPKFEDENNHPPVKSNHPKF